MNSIRKQSGETLVETAVAAAILGTVAIGILQGLSIAVKSDMVVTQLSTAEALAASELERIKVSTYIDYSLTPHPLYEIVEAPLDYAIEVSVTPINRATGQALEPGLDQGLQKISVSVSYRGEQITSFGGYKLNR